MSLTDVVNERDSAVAWEHHVAAERQQVQHSSLLDIHADLREKVHRCINVYWELFAHQRASACSIFGGIHLLHRYCATCACPQKFQRVGAACLWLAMKVAYGQDVPVCAQLLSCYWNDVVPRRKADADSKRPHFRVKWRKLVAAEKHVLQKLQYDVLTITPHDMFVLLMRLHGRGNDDVLFGKGVQILITMTLSREHQTPYLPSQVAVAVALTCGLQVDGRWLVPGWEETFAWVQRFV